MGYRTVIYILIASLVFQPTDGLLCTIGAGVVGLVTAPVLAPAALGALGFGAGGIAAGSLGASWMTSYGGSVVAGSALSIAQSVGAAGIGIVGQAVGGGVGAAVGAVITLLF